MTAPPTSPRTDAAVDLRTLLAGLGALLLLISLFLDWYGEPGGGGAITAWTAFELVDLALAALALVVLYEIVRGFSPADHWPGLTGISRVAGPVALVLVLVSIIDEPPVTSFIDSELELGAWLALAGALLMTVGALLTRVRVSLVTTPGEPARDDPRTTPPYDPETRTRPLP